MKTGRFRFPWLLAAAASVAASTLAGGVGLGASSPRPSVLLVTIDTARCDHLSLYGYPRETSPRLKKLADHGVFFETAITPIPQTGPAHASLLTGRWPSSLGLHDNDQAFVPGPRTLAEVLAQSGYETAAFVSGFTLVRRVCGLAVGFSHYDDEMPDPRGHFPGVQRRGSKTTDATLRWLDGRKGSEPFFLWVHYYDPHGDYNPGGPYETMFVDGSKGPFVDLALIPMYQRRGQSTDAAQYIARYDGELRYVDDQVGRLLDGLQARGLLKKTLVVVIGDHGENLVEHHYYFDHGNELYMEAVHVPLVLAGPGVPSDGRRVRGIARTPDVMPTILDLLGLPTPPEVEGTSLARALRSSTVTPPREAVSEARMLPYPALSPSDDVTPKLSVRDDRFTVLWRVKSGKLELYDRSADPGEKRDLLSGLRRASEGARLRASLLASLTARLGPDLRRGVPDGAVIEPELRARLVRWVDTLRR